ncbi:type II secretion system protein [Clostridium fermenticellae]|uniref:Type II secretion system protein n=1 Tax=Clostridium fermenticellae TaxID=2068654 RepID=A0A386H4I0_9CLOT|nr:type II secretion system protein [Clostridium fermenticellae]
MKIKSKKTKGFTLIELMLVISIILVLMSFLIPKFSSYQGKAKSTKAINAAKQIQTAAMASYGDNDGRFDVQDIKKNIDELTSVERVDNVNLGTGDQSIQIYYESDKNKYLVNIDASDNTYTVKYGENQIYPKK